MASLVDRLELFAVPHLAVLRSHTHDAIQRLHRSMREEREFVSGFDRPRGRAERLRDIADLPGRSARLLRKLAILREQLRRAALEGGRVVPLHGHQLRGLLRGPEIRGEHRHTRAHRCLERNHGLHALDRLRLGRIEALHLGAVQRRVDDCCREHAGKVDVLGEHRGSGGLVAAVDTRCVLADQLEGRRIFQLHVGRNWQLRGIRDQLTETCSLARWLVLDDAARNGHIRSRHLPSLCCCGDEQCARSRAGLAQLIVRIRNGAAAARALHGTERQVVVALGIRRGAFDANVLPVGVEFFGDDGGKASVNALPHLQVLGEHGHGVVSADTHECVRFQRRTSCAFGSLSRRARAARQPERNRQYRGGLENIAPASVIQCVIFCCAHDVSSGDMPQTRALAARLIAERMRT